MSNTVTFLPIQESDSSVIRGKQDYFNVLFRLTATELYIIRRRSMSKVLLAIGLLIIFLSFLETGFFTFYVSNTPATTYTIPFCLTRNETNCHPTQTELEQYKQQQVVSISRPLRLPGSFSAVVKLILASLLPVLIIILFGSVVGGEYSLGTVRLLFTRGPTRLQYLFAKIAAVIVCIVPIFLLFTPIGILLGIALNPISGITPTFTFLTADWYWHALLFFLIGMLSWFVWAMMALCFATLGKSTTAGIVAPLTWLSLETLTGTLIEKAAEKMSGPFGDFVRTLPNYFINNNIGALLKNQSHFVTGDDISPLSDIHGLIVLTVYLVVFIGLACWFTVRRDITN